MELDQLRYFVDICESKSFTISADHLFISQPTLSKKIQALENELGVTLLNRHKYSVTPTAAGEYLMIQAAKLLSFAEEIEKNTKVIGTGRIGSLRVGVNDQLDINGIMPGFLREFVLEEPQIELHLSIIFSGHMIKKVQCGDLDIAFGPNTGDSTVYNGLDYIKINRASPKLYYSRLHPKAGRPNLSWEDFINDNFYTLGSVENETVRRLKKIGIVFKNVIVVENMQALRLYVEANLGITVLGVSQNFGTSERIHSIPLPLDDFSVGTDCFYDPHSENRCIPIFVSCLKKYLKIQ